MRQSLRHAARQREQPGAHYPKDIGPSPLDFLASYERAAKLSILQFLPISLGLNEFDPRFR